MSNKKTPPANERRRDLLKLGLGATVAAPLLSLAGNASARGY